MTGFRVMGILVIVPGLSWGSRKWRLYIDVIGNPRLGVREVRALSPVVPSHVGGICESKVEHKEHCKGRCCESKIEICGERVD